jgi:hypothetical protein
MTYGCYNHAPHKDTFQTVSVEAVPNSGMFASDGMTIAVVTREWPNVFTRDCQFRKTELGKADPGCVGCKWREE